MLRGARARASCDRPPARVLLVGVICGLPDVSGLGAARGGSSHRRATRSSGRSDYVPPREVGSEPTIWGDGRAWAAPPPWLAGEVDDATSSSWEPGQGTAGSGEEYAGSAGADAGTLEPTLAAAPVAPARTAPVPAAPPAGTLRASSTDDVDLPTFLAGRHGPVALERAGARGARPGGPSEGQDGPREARGTRTDRVPPARPARTCGRTAHPVLGARRA